VKLYLSCFILFVAFIAGPAWIPYKLFNPATAASYGLSDSIDYLALANDQFLSNPVHRYRVMEPLIVHAFAREHPRAGFFILNVALTAAAATCILAMLLEIVSLPVALLSVLVFLGSRDVIVSTGTPMIDPSLYLLIAGCFLALKKHTRWALAVTLLLAPTVKENGLFLFPMVFLFGSLSTRECVLYGAFGILIALGVREIVDLHFGSAMSENLTTSLQHIDNVYGSLREFFSLHGVGTLWMAFGPFWLILAWGFRQWRKLDPPLLYWLPLVFVQMLLTGSGGSSRMAILAFPAVASEIALVLALYLASSPRTEAPSPTCPSPSS
jgi:hypothetical protein